MVALRALLCLLLCVGTVVQQANPAFGSSTSASHVDENTPTENKDNLPTSVQSRPTPIPDDVIGADHRILADARQFLKVTMVFGLVGNGGYPTLGEVSFLDGSGAGVDADVVEFSDEHLPGNSPGYGSKNLADGDLQKCWWEGYATGTHNVVSAQGLSFPCQCDGGKYKGQHQCQSTENNKKACHWFIFSLSADVAVDQLVLDQGGCGYTTSLSYVEVTRCASKDVQTCGTEVVGSNTRTGGAQLKVDIAIPSIATSTNRTTTTNASSTTSTTTTTPGPPVGTPDDSDEKTKHHNKDDNFDLKYTGSVSVIAGYADASQVEAAMGSALAKHFGANESNVVTTSKQESSTVLKVNFVMSLPSDYEKATKAKMDALTEDMSALDEEFIKQLQEAGVDTTKTKTSSFRMAKKDKQDSALVGSTARSSVSLITALAWIAQVM